MSPQPWEDPEVAAWCAGFLERHRIAQRVRRGLGGRWEPERMRMAAWVLLRLGRPGAWPGGTLRDDLRQAIAALERLRATETAEEPELDEEFERELAALAARLAELGPE